MNNKKKVSLICSIILFTCLFIVGCGNASYDSTAENSFNTKSQYSDYNEILPEEAVGLSSITSMIQETDVTVKESNRKLIKTVDMSVETKEFEVFISTIENRIIELGGYLEAMDSYNGSRYSSYVSTRNANMIIRIPKDNLNILLNELTDLSNVISRSDRVEDVTLSYVDLDSHKQTLQIEQERLLELLNRAESIEDIITIESRLSSVRYQIESMESQLRTYDNQVDYSTVTLYIQEVKELTIIEEASAFDRMWTGLKESISDIVYQIKEICIWFVINIPYICLYIFAIIVIIIIAKALFKRDNHKKKKEQDKMNDKNSL